MRPDLKNIVHENYVPHCAGRLERAARSFSEQNKLSFVFEGVFLNTEALFYVRGICPNGAALLLIY